MQLRERVEKPRSTVCFQWSVAPEGRKVGPLHYTILHHTTPHSMTHSKRDWMHEGRWWARWGRQVIPPLPRKRRCDCCTSCAGILQWWELAWATIFWQRFGQLGPSAHEGPEACTWARVHSQRHKARQHFVAFARFIWQERFCCESCRFWLRSFERGLRCPCRHAKDDGARIALIMPGSLFQVGHVERRLCALCSSSRSFTTLLLGTGGGRVVCSSCFERRTPSRRQFVLWLFGRAFARRLFCPDVSRSGFAASLHVTSITCMTAAIALVLGDAARSGTDGAKGQEKDAQGLLHFWGSPVCCRRFLLKCYPEHPRAHVPLVARRAYAAF